MRIGGLLSVLLVLASCKIMTLEEDRLARQRKSDNLDANAYVEAIWASKVLPYIEAEAQPLESLLASLDASDDETLEQLGRQASLGGPWAIVVEFNGTIESIGLLSRQSMMSVQTDSGRTIDVPLGPKMFGSDIRDAMPFFNFNDFANQIVYAEIANKLNAKALEGVGRARNNLEVGGRVRVLGSTSVRVGDESPAITPIAIATLQ